MRKRRTSVPDTRTTPEVNVSPNANPRQPRAGSTIHLPTRSRHSTDLSTRASSSGGAPYSSRGRRLTPLYESTGDYSGSQHVSPAYQPLHRPSSYIPNGLGVGDVSNDDSNYFSTHTLGSTHPQRIPSDVALGVAGGYFPAQPEDTPLRQIPSARDLPEQPNQSLQFVLNDPQELNRRQGSFDQQSHHSRYTITSPEHSLHRITRRPSLFSLDHHLLTRRSIGKCVDRPDNSQELPPEYRVDPPKEKWWKRAAKVIRTEATTVVKHLQEPGALTRYLRCLFAFAISTIFLLVHPISGWFGNFAFILPLGSVFACVAPTLGAHIENNALALLSLGLSLGWVTLGRLAAVECNKRFLRYGNHGGRAILGVWTFVGIFLFSLLRVRHHRYFIPNILFGVPVLLGLTIQVDDTSDPFYTSWLFVKPLLFGTLISLVVGLVFFPVSATFNLEKRLLQVMCRNLSMLDRTTKVFILQTPREMRSPKDISDHMAQVRAAIVKMKQAALEAKYEISYSHHAPEDFSSIRQTLQKLSEHLGSMSLSVQNEQFLMRIGDRLPWSTIPRCNVDANGGNLGTTSQRGGERHPSMEVPPPDNNPLSSYPPPSSTSRNPSLQRLHSNLLVGRAAGHISHPSLPSHRSATETTHTVPKELEHADQDIFLKLLRTFSPSIHELCFLSELILDRCVYQFTENCRHLRESTALDRIVSELPDDLLIRGRSRIESEYKNPPVRSGWRLSLGNLLRRIMGVRPLTSANINQDSKGDGVDGENSAQFPEHFAIPVHVSALSPSSSAHPDGTTEFSHMSNLTSNQPLSIPSSRRLSDLFRPIEEESTPTASQEPSTDHHGSLDPEKPLHHSPGRLPTTHNSPPPNDQTRPSSPGHLPSGKANVNLDEFLIKTRQAIERFDALKTSTIREIYQKVTSIDEDSDSDDFDYNLHHYHHIHSLAEPREEAFLIFFFIFSLREVALLLIRLVEQLRALKKSRTSSKRLLLRWNHDIRNLFRDFKQWSRQTVSKATHFPRIMEKMDQPFDPRHSSRRKTKTLSRSLAKDKEFGKLPTQRTSLQRRTNAKSSSEIQHPRLSSENPQSRNDRPYRDYQQVRIPDEDTEHLCHVTNSGDGSDVNTSQPGRTGTLGNSSTERVHTFTDTNSPFNDATRVDQANWWIRLFRHKTTTDNRSLSPPAPTLSEHSTQNALGSPQRRPTNSRPNLNRNPIVVAHDDDESSDDDDPVGGLDNDLFHPTSGILAPHSGVLPPRDHRMTRRNHMDPVENNDYDIEEDDQGKYRKRQRHRITWGQRWAKFLYFIWQVCQWFKTYQVRYALKISLTITLINFVFWFNHSMTFALEQRMQWLTISILIVMSPTVGRTLLMAIYRIGAVSFTCAFALVTWYLCQGSPYGIFVMSMILACLSFYIVLFTSIATVGYIVLILYMISEFGVYTDFLPTENILTIVYKRLWTVVAGVIITTIVNALVWPRIARVELRHMMATCLDNLGLVHSHIVAKLVIHPLLNPENHFFKMYLEHVQLLNQASPVSPTSNLPGEEPRQRNPYVATSANNPSISLLGASTLQVNDMPDKSGHPFHVLWNRVSQSSQGNPNPAETSDILEHAVVHQQQQISLGLNPPASSTNSLQPPIPRLGSEAVGNGWSSDLLAQVGYPFATFPPPKPVLASHQRLNTQLRKLFRKIQDLLGRTNAMYKDAAIEPRLQGPFAAKAYGEILQRLQNVLDRFISMAVTVNYISPTVHEAIITPFNYHGRRDVTAAILINFYALAGALQTKTPLPPYLPSARAARKRLITRIRLYLAHSLQRRGQEEYPEAALPQYRLPGGEGPDSLAFDDPLPPKSQHRGSHPSGLESPPTTTAPALKEKIGATLAKPTLTIPARETLPKGFHHFSNSQLGQVPTTPIDRPGPSDHRRHLSTAVGTAGENVSKGSVEHHHQFQKYVPLQHSLLVTSPSTPSAYQPRLPSPDIHSEGGEEEDLGLMMRCTSTPAHMDAVADHGKTEEGISRTSNPPPNSASENTQHQGTFQPAAISPLDSPNLEPSTTTSGSQPMLRTFYWYAYSAALEEVIEELENLVVLVKEVVGERDLVSGLVDSKDW
ncbi:hypothetical protein IWQ61_005732 [Dispira simplex]|nr:hypothetical protein IWQ61_005732 [Dispira simplex]